MRGPQRLNSFLFLVLQFQPIERHFFLELWRRSGVIPRKLFVRTKYEEKTFSLSCGHEKMQGQCRSEPCALCYLFRVTVAVCITRGFLCRNPFPCVYNTKVGLISQLGGQLYETHSSGQTRPRPPLHDHSLFSLGASAGHLELAGEAEEPPSLAKGLAGHAAPAVNDRIHEGARCTLLLLSQGRRRQAAEHLRFCLRR